MKLKVIDQSSAKVETHMGGNVPYGSVFKGIIRGVPGIWFCSHAGFVNLETSVAQSIFDTSKGGNYVEIINYWPMEAELRIVGERYSG